MLKNFKKVAILLVVIICLNSFIGCNNKTQSNSELFFRIHIRANSNTESDQSVKYKVKEAVSNYLTPLLAKCVDKKSAYMTVQNNLVSIKEISDIVLLENGYAYTAETNINREEFPLRSYGDFALESGEYDALIINLGSGTGDNWWCVVYPPLCFVGGEENLTGKISYKSKILELIDEFKKNIYIENTED